MYYENNINKTNFGHLEVKDWELYYFINLKVKSTSIQNCKIFAMINPNSACERIIFNKKWVFFSLITFLYIIK